MPREQNTHRETWETSLRGWMVEESLMSIRVQQGKGLLQAESKFKDSEVYLGKSSLVGWHKGVLTQILCFL